MIRTTLLTTGLLAAIGLTNGIAHAENTFVETFTATTYKDAAGTTADWNTALGELRLPPFSPSELGNYDTPGLNLSNAVAGDLAFVGDTAGLRVIDISDPENPTLLGTVSPSLACYGVAADGDYVYIADGLSGLRVVSVSNPAAPVVLSTSATSDARGVAASGNIVLVADQAAGLRVFNVTLPASPVLIATYDTPGLATGVFVAGMHAFVADGSAGLIIIDFRIPSAPTLVGSYDTAGSALGVHVDGRRAFVADGAGGLTVIDIGNLASPVGIGSYDTPGNAEGVFVTGDRAYVADGIFGLHIVDITNPALPSPLYTFDTFGTAHNVVVAGNDAFVADHGRFRVIRISQPNADPTMVGTYDTPGFATGVAVAGDLAFVADLSGGLQIVDIGNPASPTLMGSMSTGGSVAGIAVEGNRAYVAAGGSGLHIVDISNPAAPVSIGSFVAGVSFAENVAIVNKLAILVDESRLMFLYIDNPAAPLHLATYVHAPGTFGIATAGDIALTWHVGVGLRIFNIANPSVPSIIGTYSGVTGIGNSIAVAGDLAFVAHSSLGLLIIDITNPAAPTLVGSYNTPGVATGVAVTGDLVCVTDTDAGVHIIDITDPANPTLIGSHDTPGLARGVAVAGERAFVADDTAGLRLIRVHQYELDLSRNRGRSLSVDQSSETITKVRLSSTQTAGVTWEASANGGTDWQPILPDNAWNAVAVSGSELQWRSTHTSTGGSNPTVFDLRLDWLNHGALIDAISDIPNDQGRQVRVEWTRSGHDFIGDPTQIVEYAIYRRIDSSAGAASYPATASSFDHLSPATRENALMMLAAGWDFVTIVPVLVEDSYAVVVPTLEDSTIVSGQHYTTFRVTALTGTPGVFFHSPPDSGYSVDNIAPSVPSSFAVAYNTGSGNALSWDESPDEDFQYFRVYRSNDPNFTPSLGTLVDETIATNWSDPDYDGWTVYYKVTALDYVGNESAPTGSGSVTDIADATPRTYALHPNVPNPFNPTTLVRYDVPEGGGEMSIRIYDVSGRLVKTLVEGLQPAGSKSATWDGRDERGQNVSSGVYFYRMSAGNFAQTRKMVLLK